MTTYFFIFCIAILIGFFFKITLQKKYAKYIKNNKEKEKPQLTSLQMTFRKIAKSLSNLFPIAKTDSDEYLKQLQTAGIKLDPSIWHGFSVLMSISAIFLSVFLVFSNSKSGFFMQSVYIFGPSLIALGLPKFIIKNATKKRQARIEASLPYVLDLLSISVVAGMPINAAFREIAKIYKGDLADEFNIVDRDINLLSYTREEALEAMAERCDVKGVTTFCSALIQSSKQGTPVSKILIGQSKISRKIYKNKIDTQVNKVSTKMLIPLVAFFIPAIFIVTLAPIALQIVEAVGTMTK